MDIIENLILIELFKELSVTEIIKLINVTVYCQYKCLYQKHGVP